jgi:endonuclease YncB( thermonuclease family)
LRASRLLRPRRGIRSGHGASCHGRGRDHRTNGWRGLRRERYDFSIRLGRRRAVYDGDTLTLRDGRRIRLVQIDTPELGTGECYSRAARNALLNLAPPGVRVVLEADPALDKVDRYGRLLRYIRRNGSNVNLELVRRGAATRYFYRGDRGRYASRLMPAARAARAAKRGLWGACPGTKLDPSLPPPPGGAAPPRDGKCDPNYSGGCVPPYPPDLDCAHLRRLGIALPVRVIGQDPHRLDGDGDGLGCE